MSLNQTNFDVVMLTTVHKATDVRIFHREAKTLAKAGLSVCIVGPHSKSEYLSGILISALPKSRNRAERLILGWTALRRALQCSGKMYIFHDPELFWVGLALVMAGKKVVFDCHENLPMQLLQKPWLPKPLGWLMVPIVSFGLWLGTRIVTGAITPSEAMTKLFPVESTIMIRNFPPQEALKVSQCGRPMHMRRNIVIYAGGLCQVRGISELVEAFRGLENVAELWLVGEFVEEDFKQHILGSLPSNVVWLGWKEYPELLKLYQQSKVGAVVLYPTRSYRHSTPTKMFEYLGSGLPVVASNFPEWSELLEGCGIQVDPHDASQIREAIRCLFTNYSQTASMSATGRERVAKYFNWDREGKRLITYCSELVCSAQHVTP